MGSMGKKHRLFEFPSSDINDSMIHNCVPDGKYRGIKATDQCICVCV